MPAVPGYRRVVVQTFMTEVANNINVLIVSAHGGNCQA